MPYFTQEQEEEAVALILKECNFCGHGDSFYNSLMNMSYVERDEEGFVVSLVDLGLHHLSRVVLNDKDTIENPTREPTITTTTIATRHWSMPSAIGYLTRLRKLTVYHCKSFPPAIINLSDSLQEIAFHFCDELDFDALPSEFEHLKQLTDFRIHGRTCIGRTSRSQRILPIHRLQNFSNLRYLYYRGGNSIDSIDNEREEINYVLHRAVGIPTSPDANSRLIQDLLSDKIQFKKSLEILEIEGGNLTEFTVANMFSEVLPRYPNLKRLILPNNKIRSLAPIIAQQPPVIPPTVRLRCFYLMGNPVLEVGTGPLGSYQSNELLKHRPEQTNLLRILSLYEEITSLGHGITESGLCKTEMLLALDRNDGGKVLLSERFKPIALSVWPIVLERVNQRKGYYDSSNVLYHLLRNGPVLGKRRANKPASCCSPVITAAAIVADDPDDTIWPSTVDSVLGVSPITQSIMSSAVVTPTRNSLAMTTAKKRKISMP
jgi:Leucine-rich repeat (LRR) protein